MDGRTDGQNGSYLLLEMSLIKCLDVKVVSHFVNSRSSFHSALRSFLLLDFTHVLIYLVFIYMFTLYSTSVPVLFGDDHVLHAALGVQQMAL